MASNSFYIPKEILIIEKDGNSTGASFDTPRNSTGNGAPSSYGFKPEVLPDSNRNSVGSNKRNSLVNNNRNSGSSSNRVSFDPSIPDDDEDGPPVPPKMDSYNGPPPIGFEPIATSPPSDSLYPPIDHGAPPAVETPDSVGTTAVPIGFEATADGIDNTGFVPDDLPPPPPTDTTADEVITTAPAAAAVVATSIPGSDQDPTEVRVDNGEKQLNMKERETCDFKDGVRQIDYVLAWDDTEDDPKKAEKREMFQANLLEEGIEVEQEPKELSQNGKTAYLKLHAPWDTLCRYAELMGMKMPIQEYDFEEDLAANCWSKMPSPFELDRDFIPEEPDAFTAAFHRDRIELFIIKDKRTFFTNAQRSRIVYELMSRLRYDPDEDDKIGIDRMVGNGSYTAAFPLHEGPYSSEHSLLVHGAQNDRHLLYESWAKPSRFYKYQPLDLIRKYFGEKIGIYFAWLGFYTSMLIPASVIGVACFIYGVVTLMDNVPSNEICNKAGSGNLTMCPLCDGRCDYWKLFTSCDYSRATYLFDNPATVFFAGFMSLWATCFLEFWKRKQAELEYDWDVMDFELEESAHVRPEFEVKVKHKKKNPITQRYEPYLPIYSKIPRNCGSCLVILFMVTLVLAAVMGVIVYRIIIVSVFAAQNDELIKSRAKLLTTITAACLNLIVIIVLNRIYQFVAIFLTDLERHRTDTEYEDSFTFKMFLFQFINYYSSIFYIAFFKGSFSQYPSSKEQYLPNVFRSGDQGFKVDECDPAGCLIELCIQLAIVMVGKQALNNTKEILIPKIRTWWNARKATKSETEDNLYTRWEQDHDLLPLPPLGMFEEYLEMVIQYGFVTIFVAAFPLAPLFALLNNIIEVRLDAYKFVTQLRRPPALRAQDIGIWFGLLKGITFIAVLTNAFIIGWTSDFIPKMVYKFRINPNHTLEGYINWSLSDFATKDFQAQSMPKNSSYPNQMDCRYRDFRYPPNSPMGVKYEHTRTYWHVLCARMIFVILFEHAVFFLTWLLAYLIPDMPGDVKNAMLREQFLAKEAVYSSALEKDKKDKKDEDNDLRKREGFSPDDNY